MKRKILSLVLVLVLGIMLIVLTGCGSKEPADIAKEIEEAVNNAIDEVSKDDESILVKNLQNALDDRYTILGVETPSGSGILSVKDYIEPDEELPGNQAAMSVVDSVDYLIIYDSTSEKEFRVRIFRQTNPPLASCDADSEITK